MSFCFSIDTYMCMGKYLWFYYSVQWFPLPQINKARAYREFDYIATATPSLFTESAECDRVPTERWREVTTVEWRSL